MMPVIQCKNIAKTFQDGNLKVEVLKKIDLTISQAETIAVVGPSGSGKSTLLHILGGLDKPSSGEVFLKGESIHAMSERKRCHMRNKELGFVYQFHHLLPEFTAQENVAMPLLIRGINPDKAMHTAAEMLSQVGLSERLKHKLSQLSGGERQRTAIARALVSEPSCLLADEPTGNLDQATADKVYELLLSLNKQLKTSILIVTHDRQLANRMDRCLYLDAGIIRQV